MKSSRVIVDVVLRTVLFIALIEVEGIILQPLSRHRFFFTIISSSSFMYLASAYMMCEGSLKKKSCCFDNINIHALFTFNIVTLTDVPFEILV
jgi:hypothetical protein